MFHSTKQLSFKSLKLISSSLTTTASRFKTYQLIVVGGGSGGISVASKFKNLNNNELAIIEPSDV